MKTATKRKTKKSKISSSMPLILIPLLIVVALFLASCTTPGNSTNTTDSYSFIGFNRVCSEPTDGSVNFNPILGYFKTLALNGTPFPVPFVWFKQHNEDGSVSEVQGMC
jgi:hypothetical protein